MLLLGLLLVNSIGNLGLISYTEAARPKVLPGVITESYYIVDI